VGEERKKQLLGVAVEGRFDSFFKDKPSPLSAVESPDEEDKEDKENMAKRVPADGAEEEKEEEPPVVSRMIDRSPGSARIVLFASNTFLTDEMLDLATSGLQTRYLKPVQLIENVVDWSLEDRGLLSIRGRAHFSRTLDPIDRDGQIFWEYLNYGMAIAGLILVWVIRRKMKQKAASRYSVVMGMVPKAEA
jgi:ABC-2 type transport system permease protein